MYDEKKLNKFWWFIVGFWFLAIIAMGVIGLNIYKMAETPAQVVKQEAQVVKQESKEIKQLTSNVVVIENRDKCEEGNVMYFLRKEDGKNFLRCGTSRDIDQ